MSTLLHNAFVFRGADQPALPDGAILIDGSKITWIGAMSALPAEAALAHRVDLGGQVVIPGLINTHAHGGLSTHRGCCDEGDLFEWAAALAPHTSHLTIEDNRRGCTLAVLEMLRNGITTACDCTRFGAGVFSEVATGLGMRSLGGALANSPELRPTGRPNWPLALEETRAALARNASNPLARFYLGAHSPYSCTPDLLQEVKQAADDLGLPFVIHAAENRRETEMIEARYGKSPIRWLADLGVLDANSILAHCVWLNEADIQILARSGASVAHNPASNAKLASGVAPVPAMRAAGISVGLGTDSTLSNNSLDLFQEMKLSVLMQRIHTLDGTVMGAGDAFRMATSEGAKVLGWADEIGQLAPGFQADLVVLDLRHPLGLTPGRVLSDIVYRIGPREVRAVMVAGEMILEDGAFSRIDALQVEMEIYDHYGNIPEG
jgi:5-methylthioadenosine/S-adenosylhomocysteine deaminase